jgi:hypothetical protein
MKQSTKMNRHTIRARLSRKGGRKNLRHIYHRSMFADKRQTYGHESYLKPLSRGMQALSPQEERAKRIVAFIKQNAPTIVVCTSVLWCLGSIAFGVDVDALKEPVKDLKETIFGGWMWVPKIGAAVGGCLLAVYNQSIMPLATGAGVGLGIHFYDLYIKAEGALI